MPAAIATAVATAALAEGSVALTAAFAMAVAKAFAVNVLLRAVGQALTPKPGKAAGSAYDSGARTVTIREPIGARQVVFGTDRVGGKITHVYNDAQYLGMVITWTGHRVHAVRILQANDEALEQDDDGWMVTGRYRGFLGFESGRGVSATQELPFAEQWSGGSWSADHLQRGCAKTHIHFVRSREVFPNGLANYSAIIDGFDYVYDPRDTTYKFTNNSALVAAAWLTTPALNKRAVAWAKINETALIAAANICDERVSTVYQPAFTVNASTDELTFAADEAQFEDGDAVEYTTTSGAAGGLASGSVYYFIRTGTDTAKLATTRENALAGVAIDLTSAGSGTQTLERFHTFTVDITRDRVLFDVAERRLERGDGVRLESTATLPAGLSTGTTYYVIPVNDTKIQLASSFANAWAGTAINITDAGSGTHRLRAYDEARYTTNGSFSLDQDRQEIKAMLEAPMAGHIVKIGGEWHVLAGAYSAPTVTYTDTDMDGPRTVQVMPGRTENANGVRGLVVGRETYFQPTDAVPVTDATYLVEDNDERVWKDQRNYLVRGHNRNRRLFKIELERIREGLTITLQGKLSTYRSQPGDIIGLTVSRYGWSNKPFEVITNKLAVRGSGEKVYLGVDHVLQAITSDRFAWSASENAASQVKRNTDLLDPFELARRAPPRVGGLEIPGQGLDGTFTGPDLHLQWRRVAIDNRFELGSEPQVFGADAGTLDWWIEGYKVVICDTDYNRINESIPIVRDARYTYTAAQNRDDQIASTGSAAALPAREGIVLVWAKSRLGLYSELPAILPFSNPLWTVTNPVATATVGGFDLAYDKPDDGDAAGIEVCASTSTGFTPDTALGGNLVHRGTDIPARVTGLQPNTLYYYRYRARDEFGPGDWSDEASITTIQATARAPSEFLAGPVDPSDLSNGSADGLMLLASATLPTPMLDSTLTTTTAGEVTGAYAGTANVGVELFMLPYGAARAIGGSGITITVSPIVGFTRPYFDVAGTGTDFTVAAAGDLLLTDAGLPVFEVYTIASATAMRVRLLNNALTAITDQPNVGPWTPTAYAIYPDMTQGEILFRSGQYRDVTNGQTSAFALVHGTTPGSPIVGALNGGINGNLLVVAAAYSRHAADITNVALDAQWITGGA